MTRKRPTGNNSNRMASRNGNKIALVDDASGQPITCQRGRDYPAFRLDSFTVLLVSFTSDLLVIVLRQKPPASDGAVSVQVLVRAAVCGWSSSFTYKISTKTTCQSTGDASSSARFTTAENSFNRAATSE